MGVSPRRAALDLVGRFNKATKKREGGIIGLNPGRIADIDAATQQLLSGDPAQMRAYLRRGMRNKTFDPIVNRAIRNGSRVPADEVRKIIGRMTSNHLRARGETIARAELLGSLHHAQDEGLAQLVDSGKLRQDQIDADWDAANDDDTRDSHAFMDGQQMDSSGYFTTGNGYRMRFPGDQGDETNPIPAEEIVNCRCRKRININFLKDL